MSFLSVNLQITLLEVPEGHPALIGPPQLAYPFEKVGESLRRVQREHQRQSSGSALVKAKRHSGAATH